MEKFLLESTDLESMQKKITVIMNLGTITENRLDNVTGCNDCSGTCYTSCAGGCYGGCSELANTWEDDD